MRVRTNKALLDQMPVAVRTAVATWHARYRKRFISVENATSFCPSEDSHVTLFNLTTGVQGSARTAGEFAGMTRLSPCDPIPLPVGVVAVETGFFCGTPFLTIWQGCPTQLTT